MRALVRRLADDGMTVVLSSHLMSEVEELCNRVAIISGGRIIRESTLRDLLASAEHSYRLVTTDNERAREVAGSLGVRIAPDGELVFAAGPDEVARLTVALGKADVGIYSLVAEGASLERLFLELTDSEPQMAEVA
jgi:ABC-2 type transport system ATP-binding protein